MNYLDILLVGGASSVGAALRFVTDGTIRQRVSTTVPAGTIAINIVGSFVLGILTGLVLFHHVTSRLTLVGGTGVCGGFTTFSTASFETVRLLQAGDWRRGALNTGITVVGALAGAAAGIGLMSLG